MHRDEWTQAARGIAGRANITLCLAASYVLCFLFIVPYEPYFFTCLILFHCVTRIFLYVIDHWHVSGLFSLALMFHINKSLN